MALAHFATPADYVGSILCGAENLANVDIDYAKLTRKMGSKASLGSSNLRPKDTGPGSPR